MEIKSNIPQLVEANNEGIIQTITAVCRGSWLSLAQVEIFKQKVAVHFPSVKINVIIKDTAGDKNQSTPLHLVEGKDFFTKEIQEFLQTGQADFAIHSMKDVSGEDFFKGNEYAIIDRDDIRDVAIFNPSIIQKLQHGDKVVIGTSSPRRANMATEFLKNGLPKFKDKTSIIEAVPIRGNVDVRLQKLSANTTYDGIILAAAGLNRLLQYKPSANIIQHLLADKKLMFLPLFECPPATGQGAVVVETSVNNTFALKILNAIKDTTQHNAIQQERKLAQKYGYGCSQQFGAFYVATALIKVGYAAGFTKDNESFREYVFENNSLPVPSKLFSTTDYMKDFFTYQNLHNCLLDNSVKAYFVASHKAIHSKSLIDQIAKKQVWVAGNKTWLELAKKGIWVNGSADGLGYQFLDNLFNSLLVNIGNEQLQFITNTTSEISSQQEGKNAIGTYQLIPSLSVDIIEKIKQADAIFWTSFQQYQMYKSILHPTIIHYCLPGKTATYLQQQGISPIIFPTINAFNLWRK